MRCQVLNGYVYYRAADHALRFTSYDSEAKESAIEDGPGHILHVPRGKTLRNIDFRFAPFKKGTWRNYSYLDGLADNWVNAIYRDPDGVMWFATGGGEYSSRFCQRNHLK